MNLYKSVSNFIIIFYLTFPISALAEKAPENTIHFDKAENTLSVRLTDANLADIAEKISKETGVNIFLDKSLTSPVTSAFQNEPIETGIKRLLGPDISSAFIFVKESPPSGQTVYRLDTVKIFSKGNLLSADFNKFEKKTSDDNASEVSKTAPSKPRHPITPGVIAHEIMMARKNLDLLRRKNQIETEQVQRKIMELNMKLSQNPSPEERAALVRQMNQTNQSLGTIKSLNSRLIMDEEQNVRELIEEKTTIETKEKFIERQQQSGVRKR